METVEVKSLFVVRDQRRLVAALSSFDWRPNLGTNAELRRGDISLVVRQVGFGNHQGAPVLQLVPLVKWEEAEPLFGQLLDDSDERGPLVLVR